MSDSLQQRLLHVDSAGHGTCASRSTQFIMTVTRTGYTRLFLSKQPGNLLELLRTTRVGKLSLAPKYTR